MRYRQSVIVFKVASAIAIPMLLSGCGLAELPPARPLPAPEGDYRRIVSQSGHVATLRARPELTDFGIAGLRPAVAPQPGQWMTCLRATHTTDDSVQPVYFGVFLSPWTVVEVRRGVFIDRCDREQYSALALYPAAQAEPLPPPVRAAPDPEDDIEAMSRPR